MSEYLEARGRQAEVLFGFLRHGRLAIVSSSLFSEGVTLPADDAEVVRCRLAGKPAALVQVSEAFFLDVAAFARGWPGLHAELGALAGNEIRRELVASAPIVRSLTDLESVILEHSIRAENLIVLGEHELPARELEGNGRFSFAFERGTLDLAYAREAGGVDVRWKGKSFTLPRDEDLPWHDDEVAELAVLGSMRIESHPEDVTKLYRSVFPAGLGALPPSLAVCTVLNLWGVALRKTGAIDDAVRTLEEAYRMAPRLDPKIEQQVAYNLGYAKLAITMKSRSSLGERDGNEVAIARYEIHAKHRALWTDCLALFERALELDPNDVTAAAQVRQVRLLLGALDSNPPPTPAQSPPPAAANGDRGTAMPGWVLFGGAFLFGSVVLAVVMGSRNRDAVPEPPPIASARPALSARAPSAEERAETARRAALAALDPKVFTDAGTAPCDVDVEPPRAVPRGEVTAPHLGRAIGTGELFGTDYFDATIRQYAARYAPQLDVRPATPAGVGPITGAEGPTAFAIRSRPYSATLVVTDWKDPTILEGGSSLLPGRIAGTLVIWSHDAARFVCAADVEASNTPGLAIVRSADLRRSEDDPLNRARLDLVEAAYRKAIPRLHGLARPELPRDSGE